MGCYERVNAGRIGKGLSVRDGRDDGLSREHAEAECFAAIRRVSMPFLDSLPPGKLRADLIEFLTDHGRPLGLTPRASRPTLLDAKLELDARIEELGLRQWETSVSDAHFARLSEGTGIVKEQLIVVTGQSLGRHTRVDGVSHNQMLAGQYACGILTGALAEAYRY